MRRAVDAFAAATQSNARFARSCARFYRHVAVILFAALGAAPAGAAEMAAHLSGHSPRQSSMSAAQFSPLVEKVRLATAQFVDINVPLGAGWVRGTPCVSGPNSGAMGVHVILPSRLGDGALKGDEPEALIYEPLANGEFRLVGVEFIVLASDWAAKHPEGGTPAVDGHLTNYVGEPNRYGLPAFYELHVWAWEDNPNGSFADWNTRVSCDNQAPDPATP